MPEGPEVVIESQYLKSKLKNKTITSVKVLSGRYTHGDLTGSDLFKKGHSYKITDINSKGKFIWFILKDIKTDEKIYLANTLGMTGRWGFYNDNSARIRFRVCCDKNKKKYNLYYIDPRNFGQINFYSNYDDLKKRIDKLAPDILKSNLSDDEVLNLIDDFISRSGKRKDMNIVKVLMDQTDIVSGIGNYLVAEILYDAKLSPHNKLDKLNKIKKKRLAHSMRKIVKQSYFNNKTGYMKNYSKFMKDHPSKIYKKIFPNYHPDIKIKSSFEFKFKVYSQDTDLKGNKVKRESIIKGRTFHWVPKIQK
jgi:formamidopyrimidine-DNA glycosylase